MICRFISVLILCLCALVWSGCSDNDSVRTDIAPDVDIKPQSESVWGGATDLVAHAEHGFYSRGFAYFGPGLPGWRSVSGAGRNGVWSAGEMLTSSAVVGTVSRMGSWINGRAGSLRFPYLDPVDAEPHLQFRFFGVTSGQAVSVFLDGVNVDTIDLSIGWGVYSIALPSLESGEHRLRFWFRKTIRHQGVRTPGAMGQIRLGTGSKLSEWPAFPRAAQLTSLSSLDGTTWRYYLANAAGAQISAKLVSQGTPVNAQLSVINNSGERTVLSSIKVQPHSEHTLRAELPKNSEGGVCLALTTKGNGEAVEWRSLVLHRRQAREQLDFRVIQPKRLVVVVLDDVTESSLRLTRKGAFPLTPTMDWLSQAGYALPHVFTGGDTLRQRVHTLLRWSMDFTRGSQPEFRRGFFSEVKMSLDEALGSKMDRDVNWPADRFTQLLDELELWIKLGGGANFSATIVLSGDRSNASAGTSIALGQNLNANDAVIPSVEQARRMTHLDQKLGRVLGLFSYLNELKDTVLIVIGHKPLSGHALDVVEPDHFFSPMLIWDTGRKARGLRTIMTPLNVVLNELKHDAAEDVTRGPALDQTGSVSQLAPPLTTVLSGEWLLVLQDAKRYGLFRFDEGWTTFEQSEPITQRAMRGLVDQPKISLP